MSDPKWADEMAVRMCRFLSTVSSESRPNWFRAGLGPEGQCKHQTCSEILPTMGYNTARARPAWFLIFPGLLI